MNPPALLGVLRGHEEAVNSVCFLHDRQVASVSGDGSLKLWNTDTKRCSHSTKAHLLSIQSVDYLPNSKTVVTSGRDGFVHLWDVAGMETAQSLPGCNHFCNASCDRNQGVGDLFFEFTHDLSLLLVDDALIAVSSECTFKTNVWDRRQPSQYPALSFDCSSHGMVMSVLLSSAFQPTEVPSSSSAVNSSESVSSSAGLSLLVGCEDGTVAIFDCRKSTAVGEVKLHTQPVFALDVTGTNRVLSGAADNDITLCEYHQSIGGEYAAPSTALSHRISKFVLPEAGTSSIRASGDGRLIVSTHWDRSVRLFNKKLKPLGTLGQHRGAVNTVAFRDSSVFATGSKDGTIALWSL